MSLSINLPNLTVGTDAYVSIEEYAKPYGRTAVIIGGKKALKAAESLIKEALNNSSIEIIDTLWYGGDASVGNIEALVNHPTVQASDMLFAVGADGLWIRLRLSSAFWAIKPCSPS